MDRSIDPSIDRSIDRSINQSINQSGHTVAAMVGTPEANHDYLLLYKMYNY